jgi:hypothetical protein
MVKPIFTSYLFRTDLINSFPSASTHLHCKKQKIIIKMMKQDSKTQSVTISINQFNENEIQKVKKIKKRT